MIFQSIYYSETIKEKICAGLVRQILDNNDEVQDYSNIPDTSKLHEQVLTAEIHMQHDAKGNAGHFNRVLSSCTPSRAAFRPRISSYHKIIHAKLRKGGSFKCRGEAWALKKTPAKTLSPANASDCFQNYVKCSSDILIQKTFFLDYENQIFSG